MKKYLVVFLLSFFVFGISCKKAIQNISQSEIEKLFNKNVIGHNFTVTLAKDSTEDLTSQFTGFLFVLLKTDSYHGPLQATKSGNTYMGTWSTNDDYSKLTIGLPDSIPEFVFLNRSWRFTKKDVPTLKLAPWGSSDPLVLYMTGQ